ncbi:acyl-CoA thioesterase [Halodesulfovibrio spirochaetisodalis]|uniref:Thioesterase n=1 Tax=Halodesulfovibrio spirochaetisodalis TaxID=1560234 RepID=A0A1B7XBL1_9BACT|nr:acyl-CoA thioesterase [Halodesulfovibrio spirochaetisodalis]OBQ50112.1 thioesterase [Halodesulfovibrio spirochaetisodalis]
MRKDYFKIDLDAPEPLVAEVKRTVRFQEVDMLGIVWHGHYASFFEDARMALGRRYGVSYLDFYREKVAAPIRKLHADYFRPLYFDKEYSIKARLHYTDAAKINYDFFIYNETGELCTSGYSVQMLVCPESQELLLAPPPFYQDFLDNWRDGTLADKERCEFS